MVSSKQGHAPCKISNSINPNGSQLLWALTSPMVGGVRHLPTIKRKVPPRILEHASIACRRTGGLMGAGWDVELGSQSGKGGEVCKEL